MAHLLADLMTEAKQAADKRKAAIDKALNDPRLSGTGKQEAVNAANADYRQAVGRLQDTATARLERRQAALPERRQTALLKRSAYLGQILSEQIRYDLLRRRLEGMDVNQFVTFCQDSGDKWQQAIGLEFGRVRFAGDERVLSALSQIEGQTKWGEDLVAVENEAEEIEQAAKIIPQLDVQGARENFAGMMNFRVESVPDSYPF